MKLIFVLILICLVNVQCSKHGSRQYNYKIVYEGKGIKGTKFIPAVVFEGPFDNDLIEFSQNGKTLIDKTITTDDRVGVASGDDLKLDSNSPVFFQFNNDQSVTLDTIRSYPFVYFSRDIDSDTFLITYSIHERKYH